ncbi:MAG: hypothetical protein PHO23_00095 [Candidatus Pacebacteria bacterium]|nr:hypothetical protein [Candidatus Paceibacterota bacterium]
MISLSEIQNALNNNTQVEGKIFKDKYYEDLFKNQNTLNNKDNYFDQFLEIWEYEVNNLIQKTQDNNIEID